jgi:hypothetical protein
MITVPTYYIVAGGVILLYLLFKNREYRIKVAKPERINVDTSGIASNPPQFIEVLQNKTINFLIGNEKIVISQLTVGDGLTNVNIISTLYAKLQEVNEIMPNNRVDEVKINLRKVAILKLITKHLYKLSKSFATHKRSYKKELYKTSKENCEKIFLICEQIFDYWMYIKKLNALLAQGGSMRMTIGEGSTWNYYETDTTGKRIIKPRYGLSTN